MAIAVPGELQERGTEALYGLVWQFGRLPANHRASRCALEARRMAIAVPGELQERVQSVQREQSVQSEDHEDHEDHEEHVQPPLLLQSTRVQECRADYDLKANSKPIWLFRHPDRARNI